MRDHLADGDRESNRVYEAINPKSNFAQLREVGFRYVKALRDA